MNDTLTIGRLARKAGVGVETVRFYERKGLIEQPLRPQSGYRQYPPDAISRLIFIRRAKELGFSLIEIKELIVLRVVLDSVCESVQAQAEDKLLSIQCKIKELKRIECVLIGLVKACQTNTQSTNCPIIDSLEPSPPK